MNKIFIFLTAVSINACASEASQNSNGAATECDISIEKLSGCLFKSGNHVIKADIDVEQIADDEKLLKSIKITANGKESVLTITPDTSILTGDQGHISFADINFDLAPDLAITTSFGTPNLYLDYWVFNPAKNDFKYVGNYPKFTIDTNEKTLSAVVKNNAETYVTKEWRWENNELKAQP